MRRKSRGGVFAGSPSDRALRRPGSNLTDTHPPLELQLRIVMGIFMHGSLDPTGRGASPAFSNSGVSASTRTSTPMWGPGVSMPPAD